MKLLPSSRNCGENQSRLTLVLLPYTNKDIHVNDLLLVARLEERQEGSDHSVGADHIDVEQMCQLLWWGGLGAAWGECLLASIVD